MRLFKLYLYVLSYSDMKFIFNFNLVMYLQYAEMTVFPAEMKYYILFKNRLYVLL